MESVNIKSNMGCEKLAKSIFLEMLVKYNSNAIEYLWRPVSERNNTKYTTKTVEFGNGHLIVCGCIKSVDRQKMIES